eukprot:TRINITY_DN3993_c0_g1_i3.p1 TRINITY_DN3993_c0_g1~~TRINITY_DN3993_c0_g1_i3.p1  ORF type:complete len:206 (-),score=19.21 TRINITY_DN3993_c0_g1_i3:1335-1952(-)
MHKLGIFNPFCYFKKKEILFIIFSVTSKCISHHIYMSEISQMVKMHFGISHTSNHISANTILPLNAFPQGPTETACSALWWQCSISVLSAHERVATVLRFGYICAHANSDSAQRRVVTVLDQGTQRSSIVAMLSQSAQHSSAGGGSAHPQWQCSLAGGVSAQPECSALMNEWWQCSSSVLSTHERVAKVLRFEYLCAHANSDSAH